MSDHKEAKRRRRGAVMPGFPKDVIFTTSAELEAYFAGPLIQCLECGRCFKSLHVHVLVHGITEEDYKAKHGIPWRKALDCPQTSERRAEKSQARWDSGEMPALDQKKMKAARRGSKSRPRQPVVVEKTMLALAIMNAGKSGERAARIRARTERIARTGRLNLGDRSNLARLTEQRVAEIKAAILAGENQYDIALRFGVSQSYVSALKSGKTRRSVAPACLSSQEPR